MEPVQMRVFGLACTALALALVTVRAGEPAAVVSPAAKTAVERFQKGPSVFVENRGQWEDETILFALDSQGANVGLTATGPRFQLFRREPIIGPAPAPELPKPGRRPGETATPEPATVTQMHPFAVRFVGARETTPAGERKSERIFNYRRGEPSRWREQVPSWETVLYAGLYEGVELRVSGQRSAIKYEFVVAPGADWRPVQLRYEGIEKLELGADGALLIHLAAGWQPLRDATPVIYQETGGQRRPVTGAFRLLDATTCAFEITGTVDKALPLVIDPCWEWTPGGAARAAGSLPPDGSSAPVAR